MEILFFFLFSDELTAELGKSLHFTAVTQIHKSVLVSCVVFFFLLMLFPELLWGVFWKLELLMGIRQMHTLSYINQAK